MSRFMSNNNTFKYPMMNYGGLYEDSSNNGYGHWSYEPTPQPQYTYVPADVEDVRHNGMGVKNYSVARAMEGQAYYQPIDEREYGCDCSADNSEPLYCSRNSNSCKVESRKGRFRGGCDCHRRKAKEGRHGRQERQEHQERWRYHGSATQRSSCEGHQHRRPGSSLYQPCSCNH